jgi:hypothetical protein
MNKRAGDDYHCRPAAITASSCCDRNSDSHTPWEMDGTPRAKDELNWELISVQEKQEVDLCLPSGGIRQKSRAEWKEWSECLGLHILPRVPMGWSSSITGDSTKDALNFP